MASLRYFCLLLASASAVGGPSLIVQSGNPETVAISPLLSTNGTHITINNYNNSTVINEASDDDGGDDDNDSGGGTLNIEIETSGNATASATGSLSG